MQKDGFSPRILAVLHRDPGEKFMVFTKDIPKTHISHEKHEFPFFCLFCYDENTKKSVR